MPKSTIEQLTDFGQSAWLDNINRSLIKKGKLNQLINVGLRGLTSNPTIFEQAVSKSDDYDQQIQQLANCGESTFAIYDDLTVADIQEAADLFKPVFSQTKGLDGYVSLEINPQLAQKTKQTIEEGKRLFKKVKRDNLLLKVPSTEAGFIAIEELLAEGINVNITLIFSLEQYIKTAQAFLKGLQRLARKTNDLSRIASVASVFVSRIDTAVDKMLDQRLEQASDPAGRGKVSALKGKAAVANSQIIYQRYLELASSSEFQALKQKGAKMQRVLWGSTSTKNPAYSDIKYVSELIGKDSINTIPQKTFEAFLDHGVVKPGLSADSADAQEAISGLRDLGIDVNAVCAQLLSDGLKAFEKSFTALLQSIEEKKKILKKNA